VRDETNDHRYNSSEQEICNADQPQLQGRQGRVSAHARAETGFFRRDERKNSDSLVDKHRRLTFI